MTTEISSAGPIAKGMIHQQKAINTG